MSVTFEPTETWPRKHPPASGCADGTRNSQPCCPTGKGRVGSDGGRQANARRVGSAQRRKEGSRHPQRISFAAWRTWRLCVRSGRRDLTPGGAGRDRKETKTNWATRPQVPRLPFQVLRFRASRFPFSRSVPVLRARRGAPHFVRVLKYGAASRSPVLPRSGPNGEGSTPKGEVRRAKGEGWSAKCEVRSAGCPNGKGCVGSDAGRQANARLGWFHATAPRRTPSRHPQRISFAAWRTWRLCVRSGRRDLTPGGAGRDRKETKTNWATRPQVPRLPFQVLRFRASRFPFPGSRFPFSGPGAGRLTSFGF